MTRTSDPGEKAMNELARLIEEAARRGVPDANSAVLATASRAARPSVRTVFVLAAETGGAVFLANTSSGKGRQLEENPWAALCFYWPALQKQAVLEGAVALLSEEESDRYWRKRPREAQLAAWASNPAQPEQSKEKLADVKQRFSFEQAPRPAQWRAYRLEPDRIELWDTGWGRLIERMRYRRKPDGAWVEEAVAP